MFDIMLNDQKNFENISYIERDMRKISDNHKRI